MKLQDVIHGYTQGYFLMAGSEGLGWYRSRVHALIPLEGGLHIPRSLRRALNSPHFEVRINASFAATVENCANRGGRFDAETWISPELAEIYLALHHAGIAHSFETWHEGQLAGGVLGLALGGAFIGESMFYRVPEASKVALVRLVEHLRQRGFELFDAQIQNPHLARFGAYEVLEQAFVPLLRRAVRKPVHFV